MQLIQYNSEPGFIVGASEWNLMREVQLVTSWEPDSFCLLMLLRFGCVTVSQYRRGFSCDGQAVARVDLAESDIRMYEGGNPHLRQRCRRRRRRRSRARASLSHHLAIWHAASSWIHGCRRACIVPSQPREAFWQNTVRHIIWS
jgi:hypothetical protein